MFLLKSTHKEIVGLLQDQHELTLEMLSDELSRTREDRERTHREHLELLEAHTALHEALRAQVGTIDRLQQELDAARKVTIPQYSATPLWLSEEEEEAEWGRDVENANRQLLEDILAAADMPSNVEIEG